MGDKQAPKIPIALAEKLKRLLDDKYGEDSEIVTDLYDIYEICMWYTKTMDEAETKTFTTDDLCEFTVDLQIQLLNHLVYHQKSLRHDLNRVINLLCIDDPDEQEQ